MKANNILHVFLCDKFTDDYVEFINSYFNKNHHKFLIYGNNVVHGSLKINSLKYKNVIYKRDIGAYLRQSGNTLEKYDKIIVHSLFNYSIIDYLCKNIKVLKKTYIYLWGGDFYPQSLNENFVQSLKRHYVIRNAMAIINILSVENNIMKRLYHVKGKLFSAKYYSAKTMECYRDMQSTKNDNSVIKIQIGNSATYENKHKYILKELYKFRNEDIEIFAPLSYGDKEYAKDVICYGKRLFGDKFIPVLGFMDINKYHQFMSNMNVGIFAVTRQQALANINAHFVYGSCVYLNRESVLYNFYKKNIGCKFRCIQNISDLSFEDFKEININDKEINRNKIMQFKDLKTVIAEWRRIFKT